MSSNSPSARPLLTAVVEILEDDSRLGLKQGDRFEVCPYHLDPGAKFTLLHRVGGGDVPACNVYRSPRAIRVVRQVSPAYAQSITTARERSPLTYRAPWEPQIGVAA